MASTSSNAASFCFLVKKLKPGKGVAQGGGRRWLDAGNGAGPACCGNKNGPHEVRAEC
jgi:hypothetical protein